jgi:hypothetical protein
MCTYALVPAARWIWVNARDKAALPMFLDIVMQLLQLEGRTTPPDESQDDDAESGGGDRRGPDQASQLQGRWLLKLQMLLFLEVAMAAETLASAKSGSQAYIETLLKLSLRLAEVKNDEDVRQGQQLALHARRAADVLELRASEAAVASNALQMLRDCAERIARNAAGNSSGALVPGGDNESGASENHSEYDLEADLQKLLPVLQSGIPLQEPQHQKAKVKRQVAARSTGTRASSDEDAQHEVLNNIVNVAQAAASVRQPVKVLPLRTARPKQPMREGHD